MTKRQDKARVFVTRWNQLAPVYLRRRLESRGLEPRHAEHTLGEFQFVNGRKWRFDWCVPELGVAVEIDGGNYMARKVRGRCVCVGRHTKASDYEKRNATQLLGWTVLAFTTDMLERDPSKCVRQVASAIESKLNQLEEL